MQRIKELEEKRGAKLKEAASVIELATTENRELTPEENQKVAGLNAEAENIHNSLATEYRVMASLGNVPKTLTKQEARDIARFDLAKVIRHLDCHYRGKRSDLDGIEEEMRQEGEKELRGCGQNISGFVIPTILLRDRESRDLSVTGGTNDQYGGTLVATEKRGLLGDFYNSSVLEQNAMVFSGLVGNLDLPVYTKGSDPAKKTENEAAGSVTGTFASVSLSPKRLTGYALFSDQLLMQSSENVETFIRSEIMKAMKAVKEAAFFHGTGTSEANGIAGKSGIGSVVGGTNGAAPTYAHMVKLWKEVAIDNAESGADAYFTNSAVIAKLLQTPKVSSTDSQMVLNNIRDGFLGKPVYSTNAVSSALSKGSASGTASAIFYGNPGDYAIGYWGGIMLEVTRDSTDAKNGTRQLTATTFYDGALLRAKSFAAMLDALPA